MFPNWNWTMIAVAASFHSVAILSTLFRLWYRWYTARLWWDDAWALLALLADVTCLIAAVIEQPIPNDMLPRFFTIGNWMFSVTYPILMWSARISILTSIVRVLHPEGILLRTAVCIGILFGLLETGNLAMRLQLCARDACLMLKTPLIFQTVADCIADVLLSGLPLWFLRRVKLSRRRKILVSSALSASMVINVVTVVEAVMLFQHDITSGSIIFEHVKEACSMVVCNLLVIVTFICRILHKGNLGSKDSIAGTSDVELTTVDLAQMEFDQEMSGRWSLSEAMKSYP